MNRISKHPAIKSPIKTSEMNKNQLESEINRLMTDIYREPTNDASGFSWQQVKSVQSLADMRKFLTGLLRQLEAPGES